MEAHRKPYAYSHGHGDGERGDEYHTIRKGAERTGAIGKSRVSLDIAPERLAQLQALSRDVHGTRSDVLRKGIALMDVAVQAKKQGKKIGLADRSD